MIILGEEAISASNAAEDAPRTGGGERHSATDRSERNVLLTPALVAGAEVCAVVWLFC